MNNEIIFSLIEHAYKTAKQLDAYLFNLLKPYGITKDNHKEYLDSSRLQITQYDATPSPNKIISIVLDGKEIYSLGIRYELKKLEIQPMNANAIHYATEMHIDLLETISSAYSAEDIKIGIDIVKEKKDVEHDCGNCKYFTDHAESCGMRDCFRIYPKKVGKHKDAWGPATNEENKDGEEEIIHNCTTCRFGIYNPLDYPCRYCNNGELWKPKEEK